MTRVEGPYRADMMRKLARQADLRGIAAALHAMPPRPVYTEPARRGGCGYDRLPPLDPREAEARRAEDAEREEIRRSRAEARRSLWAARREPTNIVVSPGQGLPLPGSAPLTGADAKVGHDQGKDGSATALLRKHDRRATLDMEAADKDRKRHEVPASVLDGVDADWNEQPGRWTLAAGDEMSEWRDAPDPEAQSTFRLPRWPMLRSARGMLDLQALADRLTAEELEHLGWMDRGETQQVIAERLDLRTQSGVSKREKALIAKVDAIHVGIAGPTPEPEERVNYIRRDRRQERLILIDNVPQE